jgi:hypothetical protein
LVELGGRSESDERRCDKALCAAANPDSDWLIEDQRWRRCEDGRRCDQGHPFYEFRLEDRVPENHLLRRIYAFATVALDDLHKEFEPHTVDIGRPSIDPERMIWMLIIDYCYGDANMGVRSGICSRALKTVSAAPAISWLLLRSLVRCVGRCSGERIHNRAKRARPRPLPV